MWRRLVGVSLLTIIATGEGIINAQSESPRVRPESAGTRALIDRGLERSGTFRELNTRLQNTNVIVYVRFSSCSQGVPSCLLWASADTGGRRLLVKLDRFGRSPDELTALLAHEFQHANEVAADLAITDPVSFENSFASRGRKHTAGFETAEAGEILRKVTAELSHRVNEVAPGRE
jgi:hypothetical protein